MTYNGITETVFSKVGSQRFMLYMKKLYLLEKKGICSFNLQV